MIAAEQSTKTEPETQADESAAAEGESRAEASLAATTDPNDQTPAEHEWSCIHGGLRERMSGPAVRSYLATLPILGGQEEGWGLVLSARGEDADPGRRSFLLRRALNDIHANGPSSLAAMVVLEVLVWFELDTLFWRSLPVVPHHAALGGDIIEAFEIAVERLPHRLEHAIEDAEGELDLGNELASLTTYLVEKLVDERRQRLAPPNAGQVLTDTPNDDTQPGERLGRGELITGLFTEAELSRLLDEDHLFRFRVADTNSRGKPLIRAVRYPILRSV